MVIPWRRARYRLHIGNDGVQPGRVAGHWRLRETIEGGLPAALHEDPVRGDDPYSSDGSGASPPVVSNPVRA
jgi:hypothetical protein